MYSFKTSVWSAKNHVKKNIYSNQRKNGGKLLGLFQTMTKSKTLALKSEN